MRAKVSKSLHNIDEVYCTLKVKKGIRVKNQALCSLITTSTHLLHATSLLELTSSTKQLDKKQFSEIHNAVACKLNDAEGTLEFIERLITILASGDQIQISNWVKEAQSLFIFALDWNKQIESFQGRFKSWLKNDTDWKLILFQVIFRAIKILNILWFSNQLSTDAQTQVIIPNCLLWFDKILYLHQKIEKQKFEFKFDINQIVTEWINPVVCYLFNYFSKLIQNKTSKLQWIKELKSFKSQINNIWIMIINNLEVAYKNRKEIKSDTIKLSIEIIYKSVLLTTFVSSSFIGDCSQDSINNFMINSLQTKLNFSVDNEFSWWWIYNQIMKSIYYNLEKVSSSDQIQNFLESFNYYLFTLFEGILWNSKIKYCDDLIVPPLVQMILSMLFDMDTKSVFDQKALNSIWKMIKESIENKEDKILSVNYRKKLLLYLKYCSISSIWK